MNKKALPVEQLRAEIQSRIAALPGKPAVPPIVPADRGRHSANWTVPDWTSVPLAVQAVLTELMREFEVEEA